MPAKICKNCEWWTSISSQEHPIGHCCNTDSNRFRKYMCGLSNEPDCFMMSIRIEAAKKIEANSKDIDPHIAALVDDNFWDLLNDSA